MDIQDIIASPEGQLNSFATMLKKINASSDFDEVLVNVISEIKAHMSIEAIALFIIDTDMSDLRYEMSIGALAERLHGVTIESTNSLSVRAASTLSPLYSNDISDDSVFLPIREVLFEDLKNMLFVPLRAKKKNIGALFLINKKQGNFNEDDAHIMRFFAEFTSIAITNKTAYQRSQSHAYEAGALYQMSVAINKCDTIEQLLQENMSVVCEAFEAHRVSIIIKEAGCFRFKSAIGIDADVVSNSLVTVKNNVLSKMLETGKGLYSIDVDKDRRFRPNKNLRYKSKSFLAAPILTKDEIIGFISVTERSINKSFRLADLRLLEMLSQQISENYRHMIFEQESKITEALAAELSVTGNLQQSILPSSFPNDKDFDVAFRSIPSKDVGGDFFDFIQIDKNRYAIIIADVSGKGLSAGLFMTMTRSILRVFFSWDSDPARILERTNKQVYADSKSGMFVTCFLMVVDTLEREITYSNAGHLEQYLIGGDFEKGESKLDILYTSGKPLGFIEDAKYENKTVHYNPKDTVVFYTDGVTETFNSEEQEYSEERLQALVTSRAFESAKDICDAIIEDTILYRGDTAQFDDITLIVSRFL